MRPSRRTVLVVGVGAAVFGASAVGAVGAWPSLLRTPRRELQSLDLRTFSTLAALADRVCPGGGDLPTAWALEVPEKVDLALAGLAEGTAADLGRALGLLEFGLLGIVDGRVRPFTRCSPAEQDRILERFRTSGIALRRVAYVALSGLVKAAYWSDPAVFAHVGYGGPPRFGAPP